MLVTETKLNDDWTFVLYRYRYNGKFAAFIDHSCYGFVSYPKHLKCNRCGAELDKNILCAIALIRLDI